MFVLLGCKNQHDNFADESEIIKTTQIEYPLIKDIIEDAQGYIWLATPGGLYQFNGKQFYHYKSSNSSLSLCNDAIIKMYKSRLGDLYILTEFGVSVYNGNGSFHTIYKKGIYPYSNNITESRTGRIFLSITDNEPNIYEYIPSRKLCVKRMQGFLPIVDRNNNLWVYKDGNIGCYSLNGFRLIKSIPINYQVNLISLLPDGNLFLSADDYSCVINPNNFSKLDNDYYSRIYQLTKFDPIKKISPFDDNSILLITKRNHLYLWNTATKTIIDSNHSDFPIHTDIEDISSVFVDSHHNIWIGSEQNGYQVIYNRQPQFNKETYLTSVFLNKKITHLSQGVTSDIYVTISHKELYHISSDRTVEKIGLYALPHGIQIDQCWADSQDNLWVVSNSNLLKCKISNKNIILLKSFPYSCFTIGEDANGNMWFGANKNIYYIKSGATQPILVKENVGGISVIRKLDSNSMIIGTYAENIYTINIKTLHTEEIKIPRSRNTGIVCMDLQVDKNGIVWGVSYGQGIMRIDLKTKDIQFFNNSTICQQMCSLIADDEHNIWIGTLHGLIRFDVKNKRFVPYYKEQDYINDSFVPMCAVRGWNNNLIFGGLKGLVVFDPKNVRPYEACKIRMEYVCSNEKLIKPYDNKRFVFQKNSLAKVILAQNNSGVYFYYTTLDYGNFNRYKTEFYLQGYDRDWNSLENESYAYYSHIPSGHYTLQIRAVNENGNIIDKKSVAVIVETVFWAQPWLLFGVYPVCMLLIVFWGLKVYYIYKSDKEQIKKISIQREQEKYANDMNIKYFSNISHEFRTPLTMIYGALKVIDSGTTPDQKTSKFLQVMRHNTNRMLKLINQLLDFDKIENGVLKLSVTETDIVPLINSCIDSFAVGFKQKNIAVKRFVQFESIITLVDDDKFDKILTNLLSNALKYSPEESSISISVQIISKEIAVNQFSNAGNVNSDVWLEVKVEDTGNGIPESQQQSIFERFYQIENNQSQNVSGTGIGLFYIKALVELHYGFISCTSNYPKGSIFTFILPINPDLYRNSLRKKEQRQDFEDDKTLTLKEPVNMKFIYAPKEPLNNRNTARKILVVDDDTEVLNFLKLLLNDYNVDCRTNPNTTIWEIGDIKPDLIITDVLMHGMNGYEFSSKIKNDILTCHLPIIMLTAQSSTSHQIQGLSAGADAYVTKPFDPNYLIILIKSMLLNRDRVRSVLTASTSLDIQEQPLLQSQDGIFMEKLYAYMESHLSDAEIDLSEIIELFAIGRSKFYYKVKDLTGLSPNTFFRTYKLNRAAQMIKGGNDKLSYIADLTGFCSQSYFSTLFKKQFGCLPSKYCDQSVDSDKL